MSDWERGADLLQALLEQTSILVDGGTPDAGSVELGDVLELTEPPTEETLARLIDLLAQVPDAITAAATASGSLKTELERLDRHRAAATAYVRTPQA
jgi:hypothetical protein